MICFSCNFNQEEKSPPNIIVIISDDQGYADVGFHGSKEIFTPNIDRIAKNGDIFSQGYVSYGMVPKNKCSLIIGFNYTLYRIFFVQK